MKKKLCCYLFLFLVLTLLFTGCGVPKATTPAEVMKRVKLGMTESQVEDVVDIDYFQRNLNLEWLKFAKLEVIGNTVYYETFQEPVYPSISDYTILQEYCEALERYDETFIESFLPPYWGWLLLDENGESPAFIGFERDVESMVDIVIVVTRM
jgi:hypothetical protein